MCFKKKIECPKCGKKTPEDSEFCRKCGANIKEQTKIKTAKEDADKITKDIIKHRGFFGRVLPQYHGYRKREVRRQSDKLLRDHLVKLLDGSKSIIKDLQSSIVANAPDLVKDLENVLIDMDTFSRKIQHADYGYMETGNRAQRINADELDRLLDFDKSAIETVMEIEFMVKELTDTIKKQEITDLKKKVKAATKAYEQRDEFMRGWQS